RTRLFAVAALTVLTAGTCSEARVPYAMIGKNTIKLEVAQTAQEIEHGLMERTSLNENSGMVFLFDPPRPVNFWMCHTLIPLDMMFVKNGKIVKLFQDVPPCKSESCRGCATYPEGPGVDVTEVVEV